MGKCRIYCAVYGCLNSSRANPELAFFKLPGNAERRAEWLQLMCRDDLANKTNFAAYRVCEKHFDAQDKRSSSVRKLLKPHALPLLMLPSLSNLPGGPRKEDKQTQFLVSTVLPPVSRRPSWSGTMPKCSVKSCKNNTLTKQKQHGISYFRIPTDPISRSKWLNIIRKSRGEDLWQPAACAVICSDHFRSKDFYLAKNQSRRRLKKGSIPCKALFLTGVATNEEESDDNSLENAGKDTTCQDEMVDAPTSKKKRTDNVKKEQFDPFKEYANDSTDDESTEGGAEEKQDDSDEGDNSDDDESESSPLISEKVFVKSHDEKSKGPSQAKRPRRDVEDDLSYTEEMYEFGKFVAEQLLCLSVEEAKTAQAEIKELLIRLTANKTKRQTKPSTSKAQRKGGKGKSSGNPVSTEPSEAAEPVIQTVFAHVNVPEQTAGPSVSQVYIATPAPTDSSSNVAGPSRGIGTPIKEFAVVNTGGLTAPIGYIVVPAATGAGPSQFRTTRQLGNTLTTSIAGTSTQQSAIAQDPGPGPSSTAFSDGIVVKTEPEDPEPMFSHQNIILSNETLDIKFEPET